MRKLVQKFHSNVWIMSAKCTVICVTFFFRVWIMSTVEKMVQISKLLNTWLWSKFCSQDSAEHLAYILFGPDRLSSGDQQQIQKTKNCINCILVSVEWASGKVLSSQLQLASTEPIKKLGSILGALLPPNKHYRDSRHRIFHGHGGRELTTLKSSTECGTVLRSGDTLVILPGASHLIQNNCRSWLLPYLQCQDLEMTYLAKLIL